MLDWNFIMDMLHDRGFEDRWITGSICFLNDDKSNIMVNGMIVI